MALILGAEGEAGLMTRLGDGSLGVAVNKMPVPAMDIARETRSMETGLKWSDSPRQPQQGGRVPDLRRAKPDDFTRATLARVLNLGDRLAVTRMAAIAASSRDALFEVDSTERKTLGRSLTEAELDTLARYLTDSERTARADPQGRRELSGQNARDCQPARARWNSGKPRSACGGLDDAAVGGVITRPSSRMTSAPAGKAAEPGVLYEKHPGTLEVVAVLALMLLSLVLRLLRPRRSRAVTKAPAEAKRGNQNPLAGLFPPPNRLTRGFHRIIRTRSRGFCAGVITLL